MAQGKKAEKKARSRSAAKSAAKGNNAKARKSRSRGAKGNAGRSRSVWSFLLTLVLLAMAAYLVRSGYLEPEDVPDLGSIFGAESPDETANIPDRSTDPSEPQASGGSAAANAVIESFFTTSFLTYPDVPEQRTPPPHEQAILADIDAAQQSIDVALYEYNLMSLAEALVRAQARGVAVRLALDRENLEEPEEARWAGQIEQAGIPISWQETTAFQHSKFLIIDATVVWTGSWNASENGTYRNNNNLLRLTIPQITANYAAEFAQMMQGRFGSQKEALTPNPVVTLDDLQIENYFSPNDGVQPHILERLNGAQQRIDFLAFAYTSDPIAEAMIARHQAGVTVRGVFERRNASGTGAEFDRLKEQGIAVLKDGNCYTMHHKVIIIDDATVITGSYNFTKRAEDTNDENLLIIDSPSLAAQFAEEFARVYEEAQNPPQCGG